MRDKYLDLVARPGAMAGWHHCEASGGLNLRKTEARVLVSHSYLSRVSLLRGLQVAFVMYEEEMEKIEAACGPGPVPPVRLCFVTNVSAAPRESPLSRGLESKRAVSNNNLDGSLIRAVFSVSTNLRET